MHPLLFISLLLLAIAAALCFALWGFIRWMGKVATLDDAFEDLYDENMREH